MWLHKKCIPKCMPKCVPSQFVWSRRNAWTKVSVRLGGHFFYSTQNGLEQTLGRHFGIHFLCCLFSPEECKVAPRPTLQIKQPLMALPNSSTGCQSISYPMSTRYRPEFEPTTLGTSIWSAPSDRGLEAWNGCQDMPRGHADADLLCNPSYSPEQT